jgi:antitoxin component of MazEF toxin-antitoxin module
MKFTATVIPSGNATAVEVPSAVMQALGPEARPPITVTINGHAWRSRVARMRGQCLVGISAENRAAAGIALGDEVEVDLTLDAAPRTVSAPPDLAQALDHDPEARAAFDRLPFGLKRKHVADIEAAKSPETRMRRIGKLVEVLGLKGEGGRGSEFLRAPPRSGGAGSEAD